MESQSKKVTKRARRKQRMRRYRINKQRRLRKLRREEMDIGGQNDTDNDTLEENEYTSDGASDISTDYGQNDNILYENDFGLKTDTRINAEGDDLAITTTGLVDGYQALVNVQRDGRYYTCTAAICHHYYLVTQAACVKNVSVNQIQIYAGNTTKYDFPYRSEVDSIVYHPDYDPETSNNDIVLIKVLSPMTFKSFMFPVLVGDFTPPNGTICRSSAWGTNREEIDVKQRHPMLSFISAVLDERNCRNKFLRNETMKEIYSEKYICVERLPDEKTNVTYCEAFPGSIMICGKFLYGVIAFVKDCKAKHFPDLYTDLTLYNDWILTTIYTDNACVSFINWIIATYAVIIWIFI